MAPHSTEKLETRLAWLEDSLDRLSDVVYTQAHALERLGERCRRLETHLQSLTAGSDTADDDAPPHYSTPNGP